jgi:predicted transposase YdaD
MTQDIILGYLNRKKEVNKQRILILKNKIPQVLPQIKYQGCNQ